MLQGGYIFLPRMQTQVIRETAIQDSWGETDIYKWLKEYLCTCRASGQLNLPDRNLLPQVSPAWQEFIREHLLPCRTRVDRWT